MSSKERFGSAVWEGLLMAQASHEMGERGMWHSAATVGEFAQVTTVTARKYLNALVGMGKAHCLQAGNSTYYMVAYHGVQS